MRSAHTVLGVALLAAGLQSCATAVNYRDPDGPRYTGGHGVVSVHEPSLRIVTFNVAYGRRVEQALGCFRDEPLKGADVVLLQEMHPRAVEAMADALSMHFLYYPSSVRPGEDEMGTAILSPWPLESPEKLLLPHASRVVHRSRSATVATLRIGGRPVRVYSLHLSSQLGMGPRQRAEQAEAVIADARRWEGPVIIGGDVNSKSAGKPFEAAGFRWLTKSVGRTWGPFSFDHVFVRGLDAASEAGVARTCEGASDHSPVWTLLR